MKLPNYLTLSRFVLAALLMALLEFNFPFARSLALFVFALAGITDYFDGFLARKLHIESAFGRLMDPLADKVLVCAAFVGFVAMQLPYRPGQQLVPAWIVVIIISREFLVTGLRLLAAAKGEVLAAGRWGKHKTVWQIVAIVVLLLGLAVRQDIVNTYPVQFLQDYDLAFSYIAWAISIAVAAITTASGAMYFIEHYDLIKEHV